jgi:hypothetical protein
VKLRWRRAAAVAAIGGGLAILMITPAAATTGTAPGTGVAQGKGVVYGNGPVHLMRPMGSGPLSGSNNLALQGGAVRTPKDGRPPGCCRSSLLYFGGGSVETIPTVYIVYWGWTSDPSGEAAYQQRFFNGLGGSTWVNSTTQYCQNVAQGTSDCTTDQGAVYVTNPSGVLRGIWYDNSNPIPSSPTQTDLALEAVNAAAYFGNVTPASNANMQYVISTPTGHSTSGFPSQFCAWHSSWHDINYGTIIYTNFPYNTDASNTGYSCGQNYVNPGPAGLLDGVGIVGGHEYAESITDPVPPTGWTAQGGAENGDKCSWIFSGQGAMTDITLSTGTFAVQSLWSNNFNSPSGGCVVYYADALHQY